MLATAAPPHITSEFHRNCLLFRSPLQFSNGIILHNRNYGNNSINNTTGNLKWRKRTASRVLVVVRAGGYTRRQMETPGAYELIDDETGDKVIVWGGIEDDNDKVPSKDVINWKPSDKNNKPRSNKSRSSRSNVVYGSNSSSEDDEHNSDTNSMTGGREAPKKRLAASFGRLKAQRVRYLARASSATKQDIKGREYGEKVVNAPFVMSTNSRYEHVGQKFNALRDKTNVSKANRLQEIQDTILKDMKREDMEYSEVVNEDEIEQLSKHQTRPAKPVNSDASISPSRASAASFRGWSRGVPMQDDEYNYNPTGISKKVKKLNADSDFYSRKSFRDLGCTDYMIESLKNQLFVRPSHIQAMAFAPVIEGKSCVIADQSGSGKTLAYLLPVIQRLRQDELQGLGKSLSQSPRVVILVPTAELASQVLSNCRLMSKFGVPFRSMVATGGFRQKTQLESLRQELDVLIATPGRFTYLVKEGFLQLTNLACAVLDEVDILYSDEDFEAALQILMNSSPFTTQYLFVTATLPVNIYNKLVEVFPDCEVIMGPGMHRTSPGLEEILVDCSGDDGAEKTPETAFTNKKSALLRLVGERQVTKTIVFCNKIETCRKVENLLLRFDRKGIRVRVLPFHAALTQESRLANIKEFHSTQLKDSSMFLVCTDRASRGIDFAGVDHVVLFDFPRDPSEYVRRVGRTARGAGGVGKAFIFVVGKQVSLARRIIERNMKGHPLHDVPSAYEQMR